MCIRSMYYKYYLSPFVSFYEYEKKIPLSRTFVRQSMYLKSMHYIFIVRIKRY